MKVKLNSEANFWHLAPGRQTSHYIWDELRNGNTLGYEWCSNNQIQF
jgi:hypothetical protein